MSNANATQQSGSNFDWNDVNPAAQDEMPLSFPIIFWRHGKAGFRQMGENNFNYTGGFFFSYGDVAEGTVIKGWSEAAFTGDDNNEVKGLGAKGAHLVIVRYRRRWFKEDQNGVEYRTWSNYQKGFRAHIQAIAFIRGYDEPICLSLKGLAVNYIQSILREQNTKVLSVANREAPEGKKMPLYAFWLTIQSGKHEKVGQGNQQSEVTMPQISLPKVVDQEYLSGRYIGRDNLRKFQALYLEAESWAREWDVVTVGGSSQQQASSGQSSNRDAKQLAREMQAPPDDPYDGGSFRDDTPPQDRNDDDIPF